MWTKELFKKINIVLGKIEKIILVIGINLLFVILIINVIGREIGKSLYFVDEIASVLMIWITAVGVSYAVREGRHIRMSAAFDSAPIKLKRIMIFVSSTISAGVMFFLSYVSVNYICQVYHYQRMSITMGIPLWIYIIIVPVGFFLAGLNYVLTIIKNIQIKEEVWVSYERKNEYE